MHSSRGVGVCLSACWDTPPGLGLDTPGLGLEPSPQVWAWSPWVWAWTHTLPDPPSSPLGLGLDTPPPWTERQTRVKT